MLLQSLTIPLTLVLDFEVMEAIPSLSSKYLSMIGIVIYLHIEGALYAQKKCAQLVFSCFWLQNWRVLKFEKSCQFFDTLSFSF